MPVSPGKSEQGEAVKRCVQGCSLLMSLQLPVLCVYIPAGTSPIFQLKHVGQNKWLLHLTDEDLEVKGKGFDCSQKWSCYRLWRSIWKIWVGRDLWRSFCSIMGRKGHLPLTRLFHTPSKLVLNTFRDGASTFSLGNLLQCLTTHTGKNFFLIYT